MKPTVTRGATHNFQKPENWDEEKMGKCGDLQVRMDVFGGNEVNNIECFSTWKPSTEELAHLNQGGVIEVGLCVLNQPVMSVGVVDPVEPALIKYVSHEGTDDAELDAQEARPISLTINEDAHGHG